MRSKGEIIKILKIMFPGKYPYIYELIANFLLSDQDDCESIKPVDTTESDVSKDTSLQKGFINTIIHYDEDTFYQKEMYSMFNDKKYYDPDTSEYAKDINYICYEIFNKYVSIGKVASVSDCTIKPLEIDQEKILRDAVEALSPLVDEYCPWCSWMFILREVIKIIDRRKENVPS